MQTTGDDYVWYCPLSCAAKVLTVASNASTGQEASMSRSVQWGDGGDGGDGSISLA